MRGGGALLALLLFCSVPAGAEEFSFSLEELEKPPFEWGGFLELKGERIEVNQEGSLARLNDPSGSRSDLNRLSTTLDLLGSYSRGPFSFRFDLRATASQDELDWQDRADLFQGYGSWKPTPLFTLDLGKKLNRWGKGYAWNPVDFIGRPKDPNDPDEALEGFFLAGADLVRSFSGELENLTLTAVLLPVWQGVNEEYGEGAKLNLAARLSLLWHDTDLDFMVMNSASRPSRYGFDFARNLAENLEIHGEIAHVERQSIKVLNQLNLLETRETPDTSYLLGMRHLTASNITTIVEFYHNGDGYNEEELARFFSLAREGVQDFLASGSTTLLGKAQSASRLYASPQAGRNYLYLRSSWKEPLDILYFTPAFTVIRNLDDQSMSIAPEAAYTGFTNWELRLRLTWLSGSFASEYGEKPNQGKLELRVRRFF